MLDPDYLEQAGGIVASVYSEIEAEMCDRLVRDMLAGDISDYRDQRALALLAQGEAAPLRMVLERHRDDISDAVRQEVEDALRRSDAHDLAVIKRALGVELPQVGAAQVAHAVRTVAEMLERDNVAMLAGARSLFFEQSAWAVTQTGTGALSYDEAMRQAVRTLARKGIYEVQYRDPTTGDLTVRSKVDVAVRRHVRTQLHQACSERTMQVCRDSGCGFVEVSSHFGARLSHQDWEGRCYSLKGRVTVDGVTYEDFGEATGYYGEGDHGALGDRLAGVNCRHSYGPWMPGMPRAYEPDPKHPSGRSNDEIYRLTQRQRAMERGIRDTKRELAAAQRVYQVDPSVKSLAEVNRVRQRLDAQHGRLQQLVSDNNDVLARDVRREWAGDMPRVRVPAGTAAEYKVVTGKAKGTSFDVSRRAVNGKAYREKFDGLSVPKRASQTLYNETSRILRDCDGTAHERLSVISWRTGRVITDTMGAEPHDFGCTLTEGQERRAMREVGGCVFLHNHPGSSLPSWADIRSASREWVRASIIACHDGTVYELTCGDQSVIEAYAQILEDVRLALPEVTDSGMIQLHATEQLYDENREAKWFKLRKL